MVQYMADTSPNLLMQAFSPEERRQIWPMLSRVDITLHQPLEVAYETIEHIYFLERGLASIVATTLTGHRNEVGLLGRDGMTGGSIILGDTESPFESMAQMDGTALRMSASDLRTLIDENRSINKILMGFARSLTIQTAYTALANGQTHVDQRLARWLLMVHDRVIGDTFAITHEYLSVMLGVRRTGVTDAMHVLEGGRLIASTRNRVVIKDRSGLIEFAAGSYGPSEREYTRITGMALAKSHQRGGSSKPTGTKRIMNDLPKDLDETTAASNVIPLDPPLQDPVSALAKYLRELRDGRSGKPS